MIGDLASGKTDMAVTSKAARERHRVGLFLHCSAPGPHARPSHGLCPGQEEFENIRVMSYEKADVFIVTYSVVDPPSFHSIRDVWWPVPWLIWVDSRPVPRGTRRACGHQLWPPGGQADAPETQAPLVLGCIRGTYAWCRLWPTSSATYRRARAFARSSKNAWSSSSRWPITTKRERTAAAGSEGSEPMTTSRRGASRSLCGRRAAARQPGSPAEGGHRTDHHPAQC